MIDLRSGRAVAAVAGDRSQYRPIAAPIDGDPVRWIDHLQTHGITSFYIADLDAIVGRPPNDLTRSLSKIGEQNVWVDAGRGLTVHAADPPTNVKPIVASECHTADQLGKLEKLDQTRPAAISLDFRGDQFLGDDLPRWQQHAIDTACDVILLDLAAVGTDQITVLQRCEALRRSGFTGRLLSGGGVQTDADIRRFRSAGVDQILLSTALQPPTPPP